MKTVTAGRPQPLGPLLVVAVVGALGVVVAFVLGVAFSRNWDSGTDPDAVVPATITPAATPGQDYAPGHNTQTGGG